MDFDPLNLLFDYPDGSARLQNYRGQGHVHGGLGRGYSTSLTCWICSEQNIADSRWNAHISHPSHNERRIQLDQVMQLERTLWARRQQVPELKARILGLGSKSRQAELFSKLVDSLSIDSAHEQMVTNLLEDYEAMERLYLLGLAVWKAACILSAPPGKFRNVLDCSAWVDGGWKEQKAATRQTNSIAIVLTCVMPFVKPK